VSGLPDSTKAIAALAVMFPIQMIAGAIGMGIAAGLTSLGARRLGERRVDEAHRALGNAVAMEVACGAVLCAVSVLVPLHVVRLFGAGPEVDVRAAQYLRIVGMALPLFMLRLSLDGMYRATGNIVTPMWLMAGSSLLNAVLDPLLIYGIGPFPSMGIRGAAAATAISQAGAAAASVAYLFGAMSGLRLSVRDLVPSLKTVLEILHVGAPAAATSLLRSIVGSVYLWVLAGFGPAAVAAFGLSHRFMMLIVSCLGGGVHQALMPIAGHNFGTRNYRRMWNAYKVAAVWTSSGALLLGALTWVFAPVLLAPFAREPEMRRLSVLSLRLCMSTFFLVEPQMMAMFTLQAMGFGGRAMVLTMSRNVLLVLPALVLLPRLMGAVGAYAAQPVADVLALAVAVPLLLQVYRRYHPGVAADA
jgi:putative MATE family efflux protein